MILRDGKTNFSEKQTPIQMPLFSLQILHTIAWYRTRASAVRSWRLAAVAVA
jgi:hypothetical protein